MRKIEIVHWKERPSPQAEEKDMNTLSLIRLMVTQVNPQKMPRGVDNFKLMKELHESLANAEDKEYLFLEESVYGFINANCLPQIPALWGMMDEVSKAVTNILDAEEVNPNE